LPNYVEIRFGGFIPVIDEIVGLFRADYYRMILLGMYKGRSRKGFNQLGSGISQELEADDSIWELTRASDYPWLFLGPFGRCWFLPQPLWGDLRQLMRRLWRTVFFTPLIAAMAG